MNTLVYRTAVGSLVAQVLIGIVTAGGFLVSIPSPAGEELRTIFALELASQAIEFLWYLITVCRYREITTWTRYIDWVFSTPIMLISTAMFFNFGRGKRVAWVFEDPLLYVMLLFNLMMLGFGFALERKWISKTVGLCLGGFALVGSFASLATFLHWEDGVGIGLFSVMYFVWSLYGVAAALGEVPKNVMYNGLDIFSKNFYGLFLFVYVLVMYA